MNHTLTFWIIAGLFVVVALAFLLPPLLRKGPGRADIGRRGVNIAVYRDQLKEMEQDHRNGLLSDDQFASAKLELETRLAQDVVENPEDSPATRRSARALGYSLAATLPVAAIALYMTWGTPAALDPANTTAAPQGEHDIMQMIKQVEEKTRSEPDNGEAWSLLAKTYAVVGHWPEALTAYEKAIALRPDVPSVMTGYAEALAINNNRDLKGKPMELVLKALEKDPEDLKGLELAGIANFQQKNFAQAAYYFKSLLKVIPPDSPYAQDIAEAQKEARRLAESGMAGGLDNLADTPQAPASGAIIRGTVDLADALKGKAQPGDTVFLFARAAAGGAPVAALRATASEFPLAFELSDAMAMNPDNRLSNFKEVTLVARVSRSGDVKGAAGDLEGSRQNVKVGATDIKLVIDSIKP